jgi:hypothetical protein
MPADKIPRNSSFPGSPRPREAPDNHVRVAVNSIVYSDYSAAGGANVVDIFEVSKGMIVHDLVANNTAAWTTSTGGAPTVLLVGDSDDADRFLDSAAWAPAIGSKRAAGVGLGFMYNSSDPTRIQASITLSTTTDAGATMFLLYYSFGRDS